MPYKVIHKSHNSCLIKFSKNEGPRRKKRVNLSMIVFGIIALMIGIDLVFIVLGFLFFGFVINKPQRPRSDFEIEFNRPKNQIAVRDSNKINPKSMIYPLNSLKGFGFHQLQSRHSNRRGAVAELFFEFDERIHRENGETDSPLIRTAPQVTEVDGEHFWQVPLQAGGHIIPVPDAVKFIKNIDQWFMQTANPKTVAEDIQILDTPEPALEPGPEPEPEIFRDFRDM